MTVVAPAFVNLYRKECFYMDVVYSHVCGLDVHKKNVVACIITPNPKEIRTFSTMTEDLLALVD